MSDTERDELVALLLKHGHVEWDEFDARTVADALSDYLAARDRRMKAEGWSEGHGNCFHVCSPAGCHNPHRKQVK